MLNTVWLIVSALAFGGVLERTGILKQILDSVLNLVKSTGTWSPRQSPVALSPISLPLISSLRLRCPADSLVAPTMLVD